jgi:AcrR family transcriptional regulator
MARPRSFDRDVALEKAMLLFWEQGYEQTSISQLTEALGIGSTSLYAAFGDKQSLFEEAVRRYEQNPATIVPRAMNEPTVQEAFKRLLSLAVEQYTSADHPRGCMVSADPVLSEDRAAGRAQILERVSEGADGGELADDEPAALAEFAVVVLNGLSARARDGATPDQLRAAADIALRAWPS